MIKLTPLSSELAFGDDDFIRRRNPSKTDFGSRAQLKIKKKIIIIKDIKMISPTNFHYTLLSNFE
jgi:hypothetical protein